MAGHVRRLVGRPLRWRSCRSSSRPTSSRAPLPPRQAADGARQQGLAALGHDVAIRRWPTAARAPWTCWAAPTGRRVVTGPLGDPVEAAWRLSGRTAVIEMAQASGLALVGGAEGNDPVAASTYGTGELIAAAVDAGARRVIVGVGRIGDAPTAGSARSGRCTRCSASAASRIEVACDVRTALPGGRARVRAAEGRHGGTGRAAGRRLERLAQVYAEDHGVDVPDAGRRRRSRRAGRRAGLCRGRAGVGVRPGGRSRWIWTRPSSRPTWSSPARGSWTTSPSTARSSAVWSSWRAVARGARWSPWSGRPSTAPRIASPTVSLVEAVRAGRGRSATTAGLPPRRPAQLGDLSRRSADSHVASPDLDASGGRSLMSTTTSGRLGPDQLGHRRAPGPGRPGTAPSA